MLQVAKLNGTDLPISFKYIPFIVKKRRSVKKTANAVVTQVSSPSQIVIGDGILPWNIQDASPEEFTALYTLYNTTGNTAYTFEGYWNDKLHVYFSDFKVDKVFGRFFSLSGEFQVKDLDGIAAPYLSLTCVP